MKNAHLVKSIVKSFKLQIKGREAFVSPCLQKAMLWQEVGHVMVSNYDSERLLAKDFVDFYFAASAIIWPGESA